MTILIGSMAVVIVSVIATSQAKKCFKISYKQQHTGCPGSSVNAIVTRAIPHLPGISLEKQEENPKKKVKIISQNLHACDLHICGFWKGSTFRGFKRLKETVPVQ
ncbi:MAG: hypothetical protein GY726_02810 [Proteobacteria bacterium]|nr:hypothetical protein [Pseudomonadota bacterium]